MAKKVLIKRPPPADELIAKGITLLGFDFRTTGYRTPLTNTFLSVADGGTLVAGVTRGSGGANHTVDVAVGSPRTLANWDLTGACFQLTSSENLTIRDCKMGPSLTVPDSKPMDIGGTAQVLIEHTEFDGLQKTNGPGVAFHRRGPQSGTDPSCTLTISYCKVHGLTADAFVGSVIVDHTYVYDAAYSPDVHPDSYQCFDGNNGSVTYCLFDAHNGGEPAAVGQNLRLVAESGGTVDGFTAHHNIIVNYGLSPPFYLGCRLDNGGVSARDHVLHDIYVRKVGAGNYFADYGMSGGTNRWYRIYDLDTLAEITAPTGWVGE